MLRQDLAYALRVTRKHVGFALPVVSTLALGTGRNSAIFSVVKPLPYRDPERLVVLRQEAPRAGLSELRFSLPEFRDLEEQSRSFEALLEYQSESFILLLPEHSLRVQAGVVSDEFFEQLGVAPLL